MAIEGRYVPSAVDGVRENAEFYERSGGAHGNIHTELGLFIIIVTMRDCRARTTRQIPVMLATPFA